MDCLSPLLTIYLSYKCSFSFLYKCVFFICVQFLTSVLFLFCTIFPFFLSTISLSFLSWNFLPPHSFLLIFYDFFSTNLVRLKICRGTKAKDIVATPANVSTLSRGNFPTFFGFLSLQIPCTWDPDSSSQKGQQIASSEHHNRGSSYPGDMVGRWLASSGKKVRPVLWNCPRALSRQWIGLKHKRLISQAGDWRKTWRQNFPTQILFWLEVKIYIWGFSALPRSDDDADGRDHSDDDINDHNNDDSDDDSL